jgi:hypothetical protein
MAALLPRLTAGGWTMGTVSELLAAAAAEQEAGDVDSASA